MSGSASGPDPLIVGRDAAQAARHAADNGQSGSVLTDHGIDGLGNLRDVTRGNDHPVFRDNISGRK